MIVLVSLLLLLLPGAVSTLILWWKKRTNKILRNYLMYSMLIAILTIGFIFLADVVRSISFIERITNFRYNFTIGFIVRYSAIALAAAVGLPFVISAMHLYVNRQTLRVAMRKFIAFLPQIVKKLRAFDIITSVSNWWNNESPAAKIAFFSAFIIGFVSHIFLYSNRYFGNHDVGSYFWLTASAHHGRWLNTVVNRLTHGYIMPLTAGLFISLFLAVAAFYVCKIFKIEKKINAILISAFLTTFPSIAFTNLFLYDSPNYHLAIPLAVLAVYVTIRYKVGFLPGGILLMLVLAIYQTYLDVALALCVFYLLTHCLGSDFSFKTVRKLITRFFLLFLTGAIFYGISLFFTMYLRGIDFSGQRGLSPDSMRDRLGSFDAVVNSVLGTYSDWFDSFFGSIYIVVDTLMYAYIAFSCIALVFLITIIIKEKIHKQIRRLLIVLPLLLIIPFASGFTGFLATYIYGLMIYPFVLIFVFFIAISERCEKSAPILRSTFIICAFLIVGNYIIGNNVYYLRAHFFNQRFISLTTRIADRIDPLLPLVESPTKRVTYFSPLPNEYYTMVSARFLEHGPTRDGGLYHDPFIIMFSYTASRRRIVIDSLSSLHGINVYDLGDGAERERLRERVLETNMPVWPAEGSVGIIDDIIVINFGLADVVFEVNDDSQSFRARHWISDGHANHVYEYRWRVYKNGVYHFSTLTNSNSLSFPKPSANDYYRVHVGVRNATVGFDYPESSISIAPGYYEATKAHQFNLYEDADRIEFRVWTS